MKWGLMKMKRKPFAMGVSGDCVRHHHRSQEVTMMQVKEVTMIRTKEEDPEFKAVAQT